MKLINLKALFLVLMTCIASVHALATTVTYTATSTSAVTVEGTAPEGSTATLYHNYSNKFQLTANKKDVLTLKGFGGMKITGIKMNMRSNKAGGAGTFSAVAGTTTLAAISSSTTFDKWYDNTAYSQDFIDVTATMVDANHTIGADEDVVFTISATVNSLYIQSYTITYEAASGQPVKTLSSIAVSGESPELWKNGKFSYDGITVTATYSDNSTADVSSSATFTTPDMKTAGDKTVKVSYNGKETSYTATVKTIANTIETAYTTEQAISLIDAGNDLATQVYVKGTISKIDSYSSNTITYWLDNNTFEVFKGKGMGNTNFSSTSDLTVGANVVIFGKIKKYSKTYEFDSSNYLVQYEGKAMDKTAPKFTTQPISKVYAKGNTAANMTVAATGNPEPTYQWYSNTQNSNEGGTAISGATKTSYKPATTELGTKYYYCVAKNSEGEVASSVASIAVKDNNTITAPSTAPSIFIGGSQTFNISQTGDAEITVESKDPTIATASISGDVVTITGVKAGTVTILVKAGDTDKYKAASKTVNITVLSAPDLAEENISFNLGSKSLPSYMREYGLGDDYNTAKSKLKFDDANDFIVIGVAYSVDNLSFTMKGNNFSKGTFSVLESEDNITYSTVGDYKSIAGTETEFTLTLDKATRYIKFLYTTKGTGNIGIGNINIVKATTNSGVETAEAGAAAWTTESLVYNIAKGKFTTICLPYDATTEGVKLYKMVGKNMNGTEMESLTFEEVEESSNLDGGVPYLVYAISDTQTYTKKESATAKEIAPIENVTGFRGTYKSFEIPVGSMFLYNNKFYTAGDSGNGHSNVNVREFKCYISSLDNIQETPTASPSEASRRITLGGLDNEESTSISTTNTNNSIIVDGKVIENGRLVIFRNGVRYNTKGQSIK